MALRYCFEKERVMNTLWLSSRNDLAVIDTEGCESAVKSAVSRGVYVYGYLNAGALERERPFYPQFKHLRLAKYDGWVILASAGGAVTHSRQRCKWKDYPDSGGGRIMTEVTLISCAFILGGIFGMVLINFMRY